jgi:phospholipid/cholesterol/gamma-HCH transport system ATP-binding protein
MRIAISRRMNTVRKAEMGEEEGALHPANAALEWRHVTVGFEREPVLRDVSFRLDRGEMIVVTGCAASGKSVLLHTTIGFHRPDEGAILVDGRHVEQLDEWALLELRSASMGLVFQEDALFSGMSVYDNAAYRLVEHNWPDEEVERAVAEVLRFVGLEEHGEKLPEELSIGMRRRLEIARALVGWPPVLLLDEPTAGLDPLDARRIMDLVIIARDVHRTACLYVTNEMHEIPYLASHAAVVDADDRASLRAADPTSPPRVDVLLLERGEVAFFGGSRDFFESHLPAVETMIRPEQARYSTPSDGSPHIVAR